METDAQQTGKQLRKHPRIKTSALVSYVAYDTDGSMTSQGMATTTNVSQGGLQMEVFEKLDVKRVALMASDQKSRQASVVVEIVYCKRTDKGTFLAGARFDDTVENKRLFIARLIRGFLHRNENAN